MSENERPDELALEAYADGENNAETAYVAQLLPGCEEARTYVAEIREINEAVRLLEGAVRAPDTLTERLNRARPANQPARPTLSRRVLLQSGLAAAAVAGGVLVYNASSGRGPYLQEVLFGDFRTMEAAGRRLDFASSDAMAVVGWFRERLPFELMELAGLTGLSIRGGRLCWLMNRRCASLEFASPKGSYCLYIAEAEGLKIDPRRALPEPGAAAIALSGETLSGVVWRDDALAYALIGEPSAPDLASVAAQLRIAKPGGTSG
ncbi:MAG: hypothetical protein AAGH68_10095 [Pseudomonadota bacterium]